MWRRNFFFFFLGLLMYSESNKMSIHKSLSLRVLYTATLGGGCSGIPLLCIQKNSLNLSLSFLPPFLSYALPDSLTSILLPSTRSLVLVCSSVRHCRCSGGDTRRSPVQEVQFPEILNISPARTLT